MCAKTIKLKNFHNAKWDEPLIFELSDPGCRGILVPQVEESILDAAQGAPEKLVPSALRRKQAPGLP